jgi:predicted DNA-binding transcriptional regulator AlpA
MTPDAHLTQTQLAARWQVSTRTLQRWREDDKGPAWIRIGALVRYRLADVEAFEAAHRSAL